MTMPILSAERASPLEAGRPTREPILGLSRAALGSRLIALGVPERQVRMRVNQLWSWVYVRGVTDAAAMTDIGKELRAEIEEAFTLHRPEAETEQVSVDGTRKWLLRLDTARKSRPSTSPKRTAARCASRARSAAR